MNLLPKILFLQISVWVGIFAQNKNVNSNIFVNQVGYFPKQLKHAIITSNIDSFKLFSIDKQKVILKKKLFPPKYWTESDEVVRIADFTEVHVPGEYKIIIGKDESSKIKISGNIYSKISKATLKAFYYQRASTELFKEFAGKWAREVGLLDTVVFVHASAASSKRPVGTKLSVPKGWFDAGDYNKYIVSSSVATYTLILLYELFPEYFKSLSLNIPESKNDIPDILDEILWNISWMMKMQDSNDGGVYHKLTSRNFQPYIMPDKVNSKRFVVKKTTVASLNFSAVLSHLSVILKKHDKKMQGLADSCLTMSKRAWKWATQNPNEHYKNPSDIQTGEYSDNNLIDNFFWAGIELYFATGDITYLRNIDKVDEMVMDSLYWAHVASFGMLTILTGEQQLRDLIPNKNIIERQFKSSVENIYNRYLASPYKISLEHFKWGSNANLLNETVMLLVAYKIYNNKKYLSSAISNTDYILGRNPLNICYVTGYGKKYPMNIHHRICAADGVSEPIPGFVVGGPNPNYLIDCGKNNYPSLLPAKCYLDDVCSYSTNEVAINWNAPLTFVLLTLDYYSKNN